MTRLLTVRIARDEDVVAARQRTRQVADALGFEAQDQTRLSTVVSEMARNVARYAGSGSVEFLLDIEGARFVLRVTDRGPGIPYLGAVLEGSYRSDTGMGLGILGDCRLMDEFEIECPPGGGTVVQMAKLLPRLLVHRMVDAREFSTAAVDSGNRGSSRKLCLMKPAYLPRWLT